MTAARFWKFVAIELLLANKIFNLLIFMSSDGNKRAIYGLPYFTYVYLQ